MDREAWHAAIPGVAKSRILLRDWTELNPTTRQSNNRIKSTNRLILLLFSCSVVSNSLWPHSLPGSSVHGISQARILDGTVNSFSRGLNRHLLCLLLGRWVLYHWVTWEALINMDKKPWSNKHGQNKWALVCIFHSSVIFVVHKYKVRYSFRFTGFERKIYKILGWSY